jgi:hypothetical protein
MTISEEQSYSFIIRELFFDAAAALPSFSGWIKRRTPQLPVQNYQLPMLGIYLLDETMIPDGFGNSGEIRFIHNQKIGFSLIAINNDPEAAEKLLDKAFWSIMHGLWESPYLTNLSDTYNPSTHSGNPDNVRFESIERGTRKFNWGTQGSTNETPFAELQYEVFVRHRTIWTPAPFDDLLEIDVRTAYPIGGTEEEQIAVQQAEAKYFFTPRPSQVAGLTVTMVTANQVDLAWTAATGVISGYIVQYSISGMSFWKTYSVSEDPALLIEQVKRLSQTTPYDFRVCATGEGGDGDWSAIVSAITTSTTPAAPAQVTGLTVGTITASSVALSWDAMADTSRYRVQFSLAGMMSWQTFSGDYNATTSIIIGLDPSTSYDFRVAASGPGGDGPWSAIVTATTTAA